MKICDEEIVNLLIAAKADNCDCFLAPNEFPTAEDICLCAENVFRKTAVILPGRGVLPASMTFLEGHPTVRFCSSQVLSDTLFWEKAVSDGVEGVFLLDAEIAKRSEYGYICDYSRVGDIRAGLRSHLSLVAVFSDAEYLSDNKYLTYFGSEHAVTVGNAVTEFASEIFPNEKLRKEFLLEQAKKIDKMTTIMCMTRYEAKHLYHIFLYNGIHATCFTGESALDDECKTLTEICSQKKKILIATKSIVQYAPFLPHSDVICSGVPYSISNASRFLTLDHSPKRLLACCYCSDDILISLKITDSYAKNYVENSIEFLNERNTSLLKVLKKIT